MNWPHSNEFLRFDLEFGGSFYDDRHDVPRVAIAAARSVDRVPRARDPVCYFAGFGDNAANKVLHFWIVDLREGLTNVCVAVFLALWDACKVEGISIPFPQREVRIIGGAALSRWNKGTSM